AFTLGAVSHRYAAPGTYKVTLAVYPPGCGPSCTTFGETTLTVGPTPPVSNDYTSPDMTCSWSLGTEYCKVKTGAGVLLTAEATDGSSYQWSFGDGGSGSGRQVTHAWSAAGSYPVTLVVTKGTASVSKTRTFV